MNQANHPQAPTGRLIGRKIVITGAASGIGRTTARQEIAQALLFLTSSESSYVTGATLAIDGGRSFH